MIQMARCFSLLGSVLLVSMAASSGARASTTVFTVANYPVEAEAANAVEAKKLALADGQRAAFRSLLRRLVPVSQYKRLSRIRYDAAGLVTGIGVRTEQNSRTEYLARYDITFSPQAVRALLQRNGVPFVEDQARPIVVVPLFGAGAIVPASKKRFGEARGALDPALQAAWQRAWRTLDLRNVLTPIDLKLKVPEISADVIASLLRGDRSVTDMLISRFDTPVVLAMADVTKDGKRWVMRLVGADQVGSIDLTRAYTYAADDPAYSAESAAVLAIKVLQGRWKETKQPRAVARSAVPSGAAVDAGSLVQMRVEYPNPGAWFKLRAYLATIPGVSAFQTGGLSARAADVTLAYPGGGNALAQRLARERLSMVYENGVWVLRTY